MNIHTTNSECFQEPYPAELLECFQQKSAIADIHDVPGASIISHCLNLYLWTSGKDRWAPRQDMKTFKLVSNLLEKEPQEQKIVDDPNLSAFVASASGQNPTGRKLRVRREYRMLTERQRKDFHDAVNALRKDTVSIMYILFTRNDMDAWSDSTVPSYLELTSICSYLT